MSAKVGIVDQAPMVPIFRDEPFGAKAYTDPCIFHADNFGDGMYRLLIMLGTGGGHRELHKTADFTTWEAVDLDWLPDVPANGYNTFQDHVVLADGTLALYQNDNANAKTAVWTCHPDDLDDGGITRVGQVTDRGGDCGTYYDPDTDLVHIYTEHPDYPSGGVSSKRLAHFTTPGDDLLSATQHDDAVITPGWGTGDPCVIKHDDTYYMFTDHAQPHPTYWVALYESTDLYAWQLVDPEWSARSGVRGGDFDLTRYRDHFVAFSEFTGFNTSGVGRWDIWPRDYNASAIATVDGHPTRIVVA